MKPRKAAELAAPDRVARANAVLNPATTPRYLRDYARQHFVMKAAAFLFDTMQGKQTFEVPTMQGKIVKVPASPSTRVKAAQSLIDFGVGKQVGFDEGFALVPAVIAMPEWDLHADPATGSDMLPEGYTYVEAEEGETPSTVHETKTPARLVDEQDTVNPKVVKSVLAKRKHSKSRKKS